MLISAEPFCQRLMAANDSLLHYPGKFLCCHHLPITVADPLVLPSDWNCTKQSGVFAVQQAAPAVPH